MAWLRGKPFAVMVIATSLAMLGGGQNGRIVGQAPAGELSVGFELNQGQTDPAVKFYFRGPATTLFLTETQATLALGAGRERSAVQMRFVGANPTPSVEGVDRLKGSTNYFIGRDRAHWQARVPNYRKVKYEGVYRGVDVLFHQNQEQLEFDFVVAAGADPAQIALSFGGANRMEIDEDGHLILETPAGELRLDRPFIYQSINGERKQVDGRYLLVLQDGQSSAAHVGFEIGSYDPARELVIDPVLIYSTYFGGSGADRAVQVEVDDTGVYLFGQTDSLDFPADAGAFKTALAGGLDTFVAKFSLDGSTLLYATYVGGSGDEDPVVATGFAVDKHGHALIGSRTTSLDFPLVDPFQPAYGGGASDGFVAKLSPDGSNLLYASYIGGSGTDQVEIIAVDEAGHAYLSGMTSSTDFPTRKALQSTYGGGPADAFVAKVHVHGQMLHYSTYLGGSSRDDFTALAVDTDGHAYVSGRTSSANFPTVAAFQPSYGGGQFDVFLAKLAEDGQSLLYSTYLGGSGRDEDRNIAVDDNGDVYLIGVTTSTNFPTVDPLQPLNAGGAFDGFVLKLRPDGSGPIFSTYLGGSGDDRIVSIVVDGGRVFLSGLTSSVDYPTLNPVQATFAGGTFDGVVVQMSTAGDELLFSTYFGGSGQDRALELDVDASGSAYVVGFTDSTDLPTLDAFQPLKNGTFDAWLAKFGS